MERSSLIPIYDNLVRDNIPQIIKKSGKTFKTETLNQDRYVKELHKKLDEEVAEYHSVTNKEAALEELADILEFLHALAKIHGSSIDDVNIIRAEKLHKRGGF